MLRDYVIDFKHNGDDHLPLTEFGYNNGYHSSFKRVSYEDLYGQMCRLIGSKMVKLS